MPPLRCVRGLGVWTRRPACQKAAMTIFCPGVCQHHEDTRTGCCNTLLPGGSASTENVQTTVGVQWVHSSAVLTARGLFSRGQAVPAGRGERGPWCCQVLGCVICKVPMNSDAAGRGRQRTRLSALPGRPPPPPPPPPWKTTRIARSVARRWWSSTYVSGVPAPMR